MAYDFTADEMFQIAIKIEENGARFYQRAAELQSDPSNREMLRKLEAMEKSHQNAFEKMRSQITDVERTTTVFDPAGEAFLYLKAMADTHGGEGDPATTDTLTGKETMTEIVDLAIGLEKESILFYLGLKDLVPPQYGQHKLDEIIGQERQHIIQLNGIRKKL